MRKNSSSTKLIARLASAASALALCAAPAAHAQSAPSVQAIAAQFLTLGASAAYAFHDSSTGSALAQITRAQNGQGAAPSTVSPAALEPPRPALVEASFVRPPADLHAQSLRQATPLGPDPSVFGSIALPVSETGLDWRWRRVAEAAPPTDPRWREAVRRLSALPERERVQAANTWINHAVTFESDISNYGVSDYWASARETLARGRGDCEDYAIAKMELLRAAGVPGRDLYLLIAHDLVRRADHALLLVRMDDGYWVLDSGVDEVMPAERVSDYRPVVTFSSAGEWMHGFQRTPGITLASMVTVTPAFGR